MTVRSSPRSRRPARLELRGRGRDRTLHAVAYKNPALQKLYQRTLAKRPERKAKVRAATLAWKWRNIEVIRANDRARMAMKRYGRPEWADREELFEVYALATVATQLLGKPYEVDHIVPISHSLVCGLHVPWNLQVICRSENRSKQNKHWPDMPEPEDGVSVRLRRRGPKKSAKSTA